MSEPWFLILVALAAWAGIETQRRITQRYFEWQLRRDRCAEQGHDWGDTFLAMGEPQWPQRECRRCKAQEPLVRCKACGEVVDPRTCKRV